MDTDSCCRVKEEGIASIKKQGRGCTDILFFLLFLGGWISLIVITATASKAGGKPSKIVRGTDMYGRVCGKDVGVVDAPYAAWPNPAYYDYRICLQSCKETSNLASKNMAVFYPSSPYYWFCGPDANATSAVGQQLVKAISSNRNISAVFGDLMIAWPWILVSAFIAMGVAVGFLFVIRALVGWIFVLSLTALVLGGTLAGAFLIKEGLRHDNPDVRQALLVTGIIFLVLTFLFLLATCCLYTQIQIAIEVIRETTNALLDLKSVFAVPIVPFLLCAGYFAWWITVTLYVFSVTKETVVQTPSAVTTNYVTGSDNSNPKQSIHLTTADNWKKVFVWVFFHLLWTVQFFFYLGYLVVAGAIAEWYFTPRDGSGNKVRGDKEGELSYFPVLESFWRAIRYHVGTVAFAGAIIALIQLLRAAVRYIERKVSTGTENCLKKAVFCCIQCCLACLECCCDKVNRNALIWTAIYGDGFPTAACSSFALIWRNLARVAALNTVSGAVLVVSEVSVAALTTGIAAIVFANDPSYRDNMTSMVVPLLVVLVLSYAVGKVFFAIVDASIDCLFFCFLVDAEVNPAGSMLAPQSLQELVGKFEGECKQEADEAEMVEKKRMGELSSQQQ